MDSINHNTSDWHALDHLTSYGVDSHLIIEIEAVKEAVGDRVTCGLFVLNVHGLSEVDYLIQVSAEHIGLSVRGQLINGEPEAEFHRWHTIGQHLHLRWVLFIVIQIPDH